MSGDFTLEQKRYLEGFASGLTVARAGRGAAAFVPPGAAALQTAPAAALAAPASGPDAAHLAAMARFEAAGQKLSDPEKWKREQHPFDAYARLEEQAARDEFPKPPDNFRWRFLGLFYVAPAQDAYMCRLRIPNGILTHWQLAGLADVADRYAGGYAHVTTRANLQIREIAAANATHVLESILDLGLCSRGAGADNIRNVTGDATAGIDGQELIDTRPYARAWHFHILNDRSLTGLPRKFNVAFDGGGAIPTLEDTNDIGFQAVEVQDGAAVPPGLYFRVVLGGITGHKDLARDTGVVIRPEEAVKVADAIVRVFIDHGDRTSRAKARLKYVLDAWGFEKFLATVEAKLGHPLPRVEDGFVSARPMQSRQAHVGTHRQKQDGLFYLGVVLPVGRITTAQMRELAAIAHDCGDGDIRLTVWQNLLISGIAEDHLQEAQERIEKIGLDWKASSIRAGLVACTGSRGCKFSASDTKGHAEDIAAWCESRIRLDQAINIHLTGCHNSCAQHYIGDIGLLGARVAINEEGDTVEGYHVFVGGGFGSSASIGREIFRDVTAEKAPQLVEHLLKAYLAHRAGPSESFHQFTARHEIATLQKFVAEIEAEEIGP
ncbi:MAG: NirA family protein [Methylovirgula sp.]